MSTRKIAAWHAPGLIDAETRDRILAYEAAHARPLALWAVFGIGALAIGLGIVSVIAANFAGALAALFLDEETGDVIRQLVEIADAEFADTFAGGGRNGDRHVLQALFDLLGGDDDLVARGTGIVLGGRGLVLRKRKLRGCGKNGGERDQRGARTGVTDLGLASLLLERGPARRMPW